MSYNNPENDVTEEQIRAGDKRLRETLDHLLEGIQIIGFDWKYIYVNDAMARHGKYPKRSFIGGKLKVP